VLVCAVETDQKHTLVFHAPLEFDNHLLSCHFCQEWLRVHGLHSLRREKKEKQKGIEFVEWGKQRIEEGAGFEDGDFAGDRLIHWTHSNFASICCLCTSCGDQITDQSFSRHKTAAELHTDQRLHHIYSKYSSPIRHPCLDPCGQAGAATARSSVQQDDTCAPPNRPQTHTQNST